MTDKPYQPAHAGGWGGTGNTDIAIPATLSLRDYYAAAAPENLAFVRVTKDQETLAGRPRPDGSDFIEIIRFNADVEAKLRFIYADAMIAARGK